MKPNTTEVHETGKLIVSDVPVALIRRLSTIVEWRRNSAPNGIKVPIVIPASAPAVLIKMGLHQELQQNRSAWCASRPADVNLWRAFGHRHEHDVRDSDTTDD